jgi:cell division protein FtsL
MSEDSLSRIDLILSRLERLAKLLLAALMIIVSGAIWAATMELRLRSVESEQSHMSPKVEAHGQQISNLEGRLHGIASQLGKVPGKVAAKMSEGEQ